MHACMQKDLYNSIIQPQQHDVQRSVLPDCTCFWFKPAHYGNKLAQTLHWLQHRSFPNQFCLYGWAASCEARRQGDYPVCFSLLGRAVLRGPFPQHLYWCSQPECFHRQACLDGHLNRAFVSFNPPESLSECCLDLGSVWLFLFL